MAFITELAFYICLFQLLVVQNYFAEETSIGYFFQAIGSSVEEDHAPTGPEIESIYYQCAREENCNYVVKVKNGRTITSVAVDDEDGVKKIENSTEIWKKHPKSLTLAASAFIDCKDAYDSGIRQNGQIKITVGAGSTSVVYCDMTTDGGGWTVFQRRQSYTPSFQRNWEECKKGFGNVNESFWLGLDLINYLTLIGNVTLRVDLKLADKTGFAKYSDFRIANEMEGYRLSLNYKDGTIGDSLNGNNGMKFTTFDKDNDNDNSSNMASFTNGPWWHSTVYNSNLNNDYSPLNSGSFFAMTWMTWTGKRGEGIILSEMKLRRED